jgi:hypothetical protein
MRGAAAPCLLGLRVQIPPLSRMSPVSVLYCQVSALRRADHSSRGVITSVLCLSAMVKPRQSGGPSPLEAVVP